MIQPRAIFRFALYLWALIIVIGCLVVNMSHKKGYLFVPSDEECVTKCITKFGGGNYEIHELN
jgi:hypothetical protein